MEQEWLFHSGVTKMDKPGQLVLALSDVRVAKRSHRRGGALGYSEKWREDHSIAQRSAHRQNKVGYICQWAWSSGWCAGEAV
jgi:hypothetical protein